MRNSLFRILLNRFKKVTNFFGTTFELSGFFEINKDYGKKSKVIQNTVANIFRGQVVRETAKSLSERFRKVL